jgi:hypothetical protein
MIEHSICAKICSRQRLPPGLNDASLFHVCMQAAAPAPSSSGRVVTPAAPVATPWNNLPSLPSKPASSNRKAGSVDFTAVMGFEGLAPELINGRAASASTFSAPPPRLTPEDHHLSPALSQTL